jgi:hypothetical protein
MHLQLSQYRHNIEPAQNYNCRLNIIRTVDCKPDADQHIKRMSRRIEHQSCHNFYEDQTCAYVNNDFFQCLIMCLC